MEGEFLEVARTDSYPLMAELEAQSRCPRMGDCEIVKQYGIQRACDDFGCGCSMRDKETRAN